MYIDRNTITVAEYLAEWIEGHATEIKPRTLKGYRDMTRLYITPRIGTLRLQAIRPSAITKFYRDLLTNGAKRGGPLAANTVKHVHTVPRKALTDAILVDELLPTNPAERTRLPAFRPQNPAWCGHPPSSGLSSTPPVTTACSPSSTWPRTPVPSGANYSTSAGRTSTWTSPRSM
ncbi:N-terminal phage integrase SAM-like domain-containing protein [Nonomuraea indica]|uniref:N-terminal phage integrase SAM-like domain-containing protein n=1 Tax=Nonomuraea indica TaxID=1581193 RepID=UPI001FEA1F44|nr:N-terminal phage integrase SAM-like domain-containing protein [Nonomuraea indica]